MEFLVPLMPLFGTLPFAAAAAFIAHRVIRHRERMAGSNEEMEQLRSAIDALRSGQVELQERVDFTERALAQLRDPRASPRALE